MTIATFVYMLTSPSAKFKSWIQSKHSKVIQYNKAEGCDQEQRQWIDFLLDAVWQLYQRGRDGHDCSCSGKINQCVNSLISVGGLQKQHNTSVKHGKFSGFYKDTILNLVAAMFCESFYNSIECGSGTVCANNTWKQDISNKHIWKLLGNV